MSTSEQQPSLGINRKLIWTGRAISALIAFAFGMSGMMKLKGNAICSHWRVGGAFPVHVVI